MAGSRCIGTTGEMFVNKADDMYICCRQGMTAGSNDQLQVASVNRRWDFETLDGGNRKDVTFHGVSTREIAKLSLPAQYRISSTNICQRS